VALEVGDEREPPAAAVVGDRLDQVGAHGLSRPGSRR
jgi:hypothetical protein